MSLQPIPAQGVPALQAANAYAAVDQAGNDGPGKQGGFAAALQDALNNSVNAGHEADAQAAAALTGAGNLSEVVTAIAKADLALQTTMAVRDRVVQAYQDIMRMPI